MKQYTIHHFVAKTKRLLVTFCTSLIVAYASGCYEFIVKCTLSSMQSIDVV
jgi:hypothetical protein